MYPVTLLQFVALTGLALAVLASGSRRGLWTLAALYLLYAVYLGVCANDPQELAPIPHPALQTALRRV